MSIQEIKKQFHTIIAANPARDPYELRRIFTEAIREWETEQGWEQANKGNAWTDDELRVILSEAPTKENCLRKFKLDFDDSDQYSISLKYDFKIITLDKDLKKGY